MIENSNFFSRELDAQERKRLDRQLRLPGWNQAALKKSTVIIFGVGGLGTEIAKNLAMAGVGTIHLVDMDTIEYSNLNRQILFDEASEGEPKAKIAAKNLKKINPFGNYIWHFTALEDLDPHIYESADIYISGLDSVNARKELNRRAVHNSKILIDGGTTTYYGHVYSYIPGQNACLACDPMREQERETLAACTLVGIPRKRIHCLLKGQLYFESKFNRPPDTENIDEMNVVIEYANNLVDKHFSGSKKFGIDEAVQQIDHHDPTIITINAVIASLQSQEALKALHHIHGSVLGFVNQQYCIYNGLIGKFYYMDKPRNKKCEICGENAALLEKITLPSTSTVDNLLYILKHRGYQFDEEFLPGVYRIDQKEMDVIDASQTLKEISLRSGETLFIPNLGKNGKEIDIYVKVYLNRG